MIGCIETIAICSDLQVQKKKCDNSLRHVVNSTSSTIAYNAHRVLDYKLDSISNKSALQSEITKSFQSIWSEKSPHCSYRIRSLDFIFLSMVKVLYLNKNGYFINRRDAIDIRI